MVWESGLFLLTVQVSQVQTFTTAQKVFHLQWIPIVTVSDTFLFPLQGSVLMALHSHHLNSDQVGRKDRQPESAADQTFFHLSLLLSFPCPDCLFVALPPEKWYHFISKTRPAVQASHRLLAQDKRRCAFQDFSLSQVQSFLAALLLTVSLSGFF